MVTKNEIQLPGVVVSTWVCAHDQRSLTQQGLNSVAYTLSAVLGGLAVWQYDVLEDLESCLTTPHGYLGCRRASRMSP